MWQADFAKNVLTAVLLTEALTPRLTRPGARVISVSSLAAQRGNGSYGAAKAALHAWNHSLAAALGPDGITCNVVVPGFVSRTEFFSPPPDTAELDRRATTTLLGRVANPEDVAGVIAFLASDDAGYITGELVQVNGGAMLGR